jgi:hypothetical protein
MSIIEVLEAAKLDYQNRTEESKHGLCFYLQYKPGKDEIIAKINSLIPVGIWYKGVHPFTQLEYHNTVTIETIKAHYAARLELIDILITHFKNL